MLWVGVLYYMSSFNSTVSSAAIGLVSYTSCAASNGSCLFNDEQCLLLMNDVNGILKRHRPRLELHLRVSQQ